MVVSPVEPVDSQSASLGPPDAHYRRARSDCEYFTDQSSTNSKFESLLVLDVPQRLVDDLVHYVHDW